MRESDSLAELAAYVEDQGVHEDAMGVLQAAATAPPDLLSRAFHACDDLREQAVRAVTAYERGGAWRCLPGNPLASSGLRAAMEAMRALTCEPHRTLRRAALEDGGNG